MDTLQTTLALAQAKAHLSQVVRTVRETKRTITVTVGGKPAVRIVPIEPEVRRMTQEEVEEFMARHERIVALTADMEPFDAVELIRDGRR